MVGSTGTQQSSQPDANAFKGIPPSVGSLLVLAHAASFSVMWLHSGVSSQAERAKLAKETGGGFSKRCAVDMDLLEHGPYISPLAISKITSWANVKKGCKGSIGSLA